MYKKGVFLIFDSIFHLVALPVQVTRKNYLNHNYNQQEC